MTADSSEQLPRSGHAIVTGGSSGIGLSIARQLAAGGHAVSLLARDAGKLQEAKKLIEAHSPNGASVFVCPVDVSDATACSDAVGQCIDHFGAPDWAVASAGMVEPGKILDIALGDHERQMQVNYFGSLNFARSVIPAMRQNERQGRLVFIASGAALFGIYGYAGYAPSKFAVRGLAEVLRVELLQDGISVTIAYPPDTLTPQLEYEKPRRPDETRRIVESGGEWSADSVAKIIIARAMKRSFVATVGWKLGLASRWHSVLGPLLQRYQRNVVGRSRNPHE